MNKTYYLPVIFIIIYLLLSAGCTRTEQTRHHSVEANQELLTALDSIIGDYPAMVKAKENNMALIKAQLQQCDSYSEKLKLGRRLYDEYMVYESDSAMHYASKCFEITRLIEKDGSIATYEWQLRKAFQYTVQGLYPQAMSLLDDINPGRLDRELRSEYYQVYEYLHSMRSVFLQPSNELARREIEKSNIFRDSLRQLSTSEQTSLAWVPVAMNIESKEYPLSADDLERLRTAVESNKAPSRANAINAYWLARHYQDCGNDELMVRYLTMAATYDAQILNREIAAMQELAAWLFEHGELNRAYNYLVFAVGQANAYHNRNRIVSLSCALPMVREAYRAEIKRHEGYLHGLILILGVLSAILVASIVMSVMENRKLRKARCQLTELNADLSTTVADRDEAIAKLETANKELSAANSQKLGTLAYAFRLTSDYINSMEDFRKKLLRKYKVNKIVDIGTLLNDPDVVKGQFQTFHEGFDNMILSIFPRFFEEYYAQAGEDIKEYSAAGKNRSLSTRMRIYALRRLGVDKSGDIARMLNISIRTVYNNRGNQASAEAETRTAECPAFTDA